MKIELGEYTETSQFLVNHNVIFQNVTFPPQVYGSEISKFLEFINDENGHPITNILSADIVTTDTGIQLIKSFLIEMEKSISYTDATSTYTNYSDITWSDLGSCEIPLGSVINSTIQTSISMAFEIESL